MKYNNEERNFDHLIGKVVRGNNYMRLGEIVSIEYAYDGYLHHNAMAVLDNGRKINCRTMERK